MTDRKDTGTSLAIGIALVMLILFVFAWAFWHYNKYEVMDTVRNLRWYQLQILDPFIPDDRIMLVDRAGQGITFDRFEDMVRDVPKQQLTPQFLGVVSEIVMRPFLIIFSLIMVVMGLWAMFYGPYTHYRRRYDLGGLIRAQAGAFPIIAPLVDFDPSKQPVRPPGAPVPADLPPFAEALAPEEWIAYNVIPTLTNRDIDQGAATAAFAKQLGAPWRGWMHMAPYRQVLLAAFCLRTARKRHESDAMLGDLAKCWVRGVMRLEGKLLRRARAVLRNRDLSNVVISRCNQHAFEATAMIRALATAREEGGVLAPAQFIWLRAYDRALWYALNNLGRNAYHMEALGAMGHYKAEKLAQRPIVRPKVEGAVQSLADYMKSYKARPVPQLDYSRSKRRAIKKVKGSAG
jgi:intracellular multiplication protein IcmP